MAATDPPLFLTAPATPEVLDAVHDLLHRFWHRVTSIGDADRMRFDLAVAEVAANVVEHCQGTTQMTLALFESAAGVEAVIDDDGEELPANIIDAASVPSDDFADSGRGLVLARNALDEFTYERADGHNHWHLVRRDHSASR